MDWANERYFRRYTRETIDDLALTWEARALWDRIMMKLDRAGVIPLGRTGLRGLHVLIAMPAEIVEDHLPELLEDGRVELHEGYLLAPNFMEAQETPQSDKQRSKESRARRRDRARAEQIVTNRDADDTKRDLGDTKRDSSVTPRHAASRRVTLTQTDPSQTDPSQADPTLPGGVGGSEAPPNGFDFLALYQIYPRKAGKADGLRHCKTRIRTVETYRQVLAAIEEVAAAWKDTADKDKCPYFSSFIYQKRWEDDELPKPRRYENGSAGGLTAEEIAQQALDLEAQGR